MLLGVLYPGKLSDVIFTNFLFYFKTTKNSSKLPFFHKIDYFCHFWIILQCRLYQICEVLVVINTHKKYIKITVNSSSLHVSSLISKVLVRSSSVPSTKLIHIFHHLTFLQKEVDDCLVLIHITLFIYAIFINKNHI